MARLAQPNRTPEGAVWRPRTAAAGGRAQAGLEFVEKLLPTKLTSTCASGVAVVAWEAAVLWELSVVEQPYAACRPVQASAGQRIPGFATAGECLAG